MTSRSLRSWSRVLFLVCGAFPLGPAALAQAPSSLCTGQPAGAAQPFGAILGSPNGVTVHSNCNPSYDPVVISAATNTNPVVFTALNHGLATNGIQEIAIYGGTLNWTPVNNTYTVTVIDANTFSIPVNAAGFGALTGTLFGDYRNASGTGLEWQCVEFARRYYLQIYGAPTDKSNLGNASSWYENYSQLGLLQYQNGGTTPPQIGDILTSAGCSTSACGATEAAKTASGHVAIVSNVTPTQVCAVMQNWSESSSDADGTHCMMITPSAPYTVAAFDSPSGRDFYPIQGWLRSPTPPLTGATLLQLTSATSRDWFPVWRPDGTKILFSSNRNNLTQANDVWDMNPDGSQQRELVHVDITTPSSWGDDGLSSNTKEFIGSTGDIAVIEQQDYWEVMRIALSGTTPFPIIRTVWDGPDAFFSDLLFIPGGLGTCSFAYSNATQDSAWIDCDGGQQQIRIGAFSQLSGQSSEAIGTVLLTTTSDGAQGGLAFAPSGQQLVASLCITSCSALSLGTDLYVLNAATGQIVQRLTTDGNSGISAIQPRWSPDGQTIAFVSNKSGNDEIWTIHPDGTGATRVTANGFDNSGPSWSPDSKSLAFATNNNGSYSIWLASLQPSGTSPALGITMSHSGSFSQGQVGAAFSVIVSNAASGGSTSGAITVVDNAPTGLTLVSMTGSGWTCSGSTCTRSDVLSPGSSYPAITVLVDVASNAPSQVINQATVSGGGSPSATASDATTITASTVSDMPDLIVTALTGPPSGNPGGTIDVSATVLNQGGSAAGAFQFEFYFSPSSDVTLSTAIDTTWGCAVTSLASGASFTCSGSIGVPASLAPGTWYLTAWADSRNQVVESNENNNWRTADTGSVSMGPVLEILGAGSDGRLYSIVPATGATTLIGVLPTVMSDIAAYNGSLYGISYSIPSVLYEINPSTAAGTAIGGGTGANLNALVFSSNGTQYAAGADSLYTINTSTGIAALVGSGGGSGTYLSSGDLEFDSTGKLYLTSAGFSGDQLFSLDPATGQGTLIGSVDFSGVLGLAYYGGIAYGFTSGGQVITINLSTGAGTAIANYAPSFNGTTLFAPAGTTTPSISSGGVVNAASYTTGAVAPGSIVAVYGSFLVTSPATAPGAPWPTSLGGLSVQFGATQAPLYYASGSQVNLQVPWEASGQTQTTISATDNGQTGAAQTVSLATYSPGIFSMNGQGTGQGAIVDAISGRLLDSSNPAIAGSTYVAIYCTGLGPVTNQPASGAASPSNPLAVAATPIVGIGNIGAQVLFAGLAPGFVGEYQVNAVVPAGVAPETSVPVVISLGGVYSNTVTIAVQAATASNPQPSITNLFPSSAQAGSGPLTLDINGSGFITSSSVTVNGVSHAATFVNANQLTITLTASDLLTAAALSVVVTNPPPGGGSSQSAAFTVQPAATPTLVGLSLNVATLTAGASTTGTVRLSAAAPSGGVQVSLSSSNPSAQVPTTVTVAAGQNSATFTITTTAIASTQTATITATLGTGHFSLNLSVNPASGGVSVQGKSFTINGTITIGGQALAFEIQTLATSGTAYFVELDNDISAASGIQFEEEFNSGLSVSGSTGVYSGSSAAGFYSNLNTNYGMPITITSATLTITFTSSAPGSAVTGSVSFATVSGTIQGTFTGTLASPGLT
jgi:uncharacterized protein (TIGR03437 family)